MEPKRNLNLPGTKVCILSGDAFSGVGAIFGQECQKRGMLVRVAGDAIMMLPTLIMTPREVGEVDEVRSVVYSVTIVLSSLEYPGNTYCFAFSADENLWGSP